MDYTKYELEVEEKKGRAKHILDVAVEEKRELTETENREYDTLYGEIAATNKFIAEMKESELETLRTKIGEIAEEESKSKTGDKRAMDKLLRGLKTPGQGFQVYHPEVRDWTSASGGASYLVPEDWYNEVIAARVTNGVARQSGMQVMRTAHTNNIPILSAYGTAAVVGEMTAYTESDPTIAQVVMGAYKVTLKVDVAEEIIADEEYGIASVLATAIGNSFATWEDNAFISASGTGSGTASGIFALAADASSATASGFTTEELIGCIYGLDRAYRREAVWYMNDATVGYIAKKRTTASAVENMLWQDAIGGEPARLFGYPVFTNSNIASYTSASSKIVCLANPKFYMIGERGPMDVRVLNLNEYSTTFAVKQRMDGHPLIAGAFYTLCTSTT